MIDLETRLLALEIKVGAIERKLIETSIQLDKTSNNPIQEQIRAAELHEIDTEGVDLAISDLLGDSGDTVDG